MSNPSRYTLRPSARARSVATTDPAEGSGAIGEVFIENTLDSGESLLSSLSLTHHSRSSDIVSRPASPIDENAHALQSRPSPALSESLTQERLTGTAGCKTELARLNAVDTSRLEHCRADHDPPILVRSRGHEPVRGTSPTRRCTLPAENETTHPAAMQGMPSLNTFVESVLRRMPEAEFNELAACHSLPMTHKEFLKEYSNPNLIDDEDNIHLYMNGTNSPPLTRTDDPVTVPPTSFDAERTSLRLTVSEKRKGSASAVAPNVARALAIDRRSAREENPRTDEIAANLTLAQRLQEHEKELADRQLELQRVADDLQRQRDEIDKQKKAHLLTSTALSSSRPSSPAHAVSQIPPSSFLHQILHAPRTAADGGHDMEGGYSSDVSEPSSVDSSDSESTKRRKKKQKKAYRKHKHERKLALAHDHPVEPFIYDGKDDYDLFQSWAYQVDQYLAATHIRAKRQVPRLQNFLAGEAQDFFMTEVAEKTRTWTVKEFLAALFNEFFPANFRMQQRTRLAECKQGGRPLRMWFAASANLPFAYTAL